jgi:predicted double-glycine peptidase
MSLTASAAGTVRSPHATLPEDALPLPLTPQATDYSCGAAALLSVLNYWQIYEGNEEDLYPILETTREEGTHPRKIAEGAKLLGLRSEMRTGMRPEDLEAALSKGETVILDIQAWSDPDNTDAWEDRWEDGHYVVLIGMDSRNFYFMDPSVKTGYGYIPHGELMDRWHDYEDRYGPVEKYFQLGIVISGKKPLKSYPALTRIR